MTGSVMTVGKLSMVFVAVIGMAACDESGGFSLGASENGGVDAPLQRATQVSQTERDVERPDIFEVNDRGLWDGRPSLGGVWVAHPDAQDPERVMIRNTDTGQSVVGALFRRERENPGPLLQVSSDAADALGLLAGAPTALSVVALRREEIEVPVEAPLPPEDNPVIASLAAPVAVQAIALDDAPIEVTVDPIAGAAAAIDAAEAGATLATPVVPAATVAAATTPLAQIGVFSVENNANAAAQKIRAAGIAASVEPQDAGGRTVWRVVAGPVSDDATLAQLKSLGFVDAFVLDAE